MWAELRPNQTALTFLENGELKFQELSYKSLDRRARQIAVGIRKTVRPGDRVLLLHPPGLEFVTAFFGCLYGGVVPVPAYPPRNPRHFPRIESLLADADVRCVLTESDFRERLAAWLEQRSGALPVLCTNTIQDDADHWQPPEINPDTLAFLQYTSGSTGNPKGVMVTHGNLMSNQRMIREAFGHSEGLVQVSWLPVYHDMGLIGNLMQPLFMGGHCIFMSPVAFLQKPRRWLEAISHFRAQGSGAPNFALRLCTRSVTGDQQEGLDLSSLKVFFIGSEPINATVLDEFATAFRGTGFRREAFYCCYGMAETTLLATGSTPGAGPIFETLNADLRTSKVVVGCGKAANGQELVIVDTKLQIRLPDGQVGEIWLRGDNVAKGYWGKPELSRQTFAAQLDGDTGYLRTGDLGYLRNGELFVTGRIKDLIIIRGRNHYPQDIEKIVDTCHSALSPDACAAISVTAGGEETLAIIVEIQRSMLRSFKADEVFGRIRQAIFEQLELTTHSIVLIRPSTLPRTSSGKIQHGECHAQFLGGNLEVVATWSSNSRPAEDGPMMEFNTPFFSVAQPPFPVAPPPVARSERLDSSALQLWLKKWIGARLTMDPLRIDPELAFADSGLDSVSSVALTTDLSQLLGFEVSPTLVWDFPTIRLASIYLAGYGGNAATRPALLQPVQAHETDESIEASAAALALELADLSRTSDGPRSRRRQP
jgi:acyl-CoA synthetase (AMP-forming)/AMP-acid ligase II/acyl carrier protein